MAQTLIAGVGKLGWHAPGLYQYCGWCAYAWFGGCSSNHCSIISKETEHSWVTFRIIEAARLFGLAVRMKKVSSCCPGAFLFFDVTIVAGKNIEGIKCQQHYHTVHLNPDEDYITYFSGERRKLLRETPPHESQGRSLRALWQFSSMGSCFMLSTVGCPSAALAQP